MSRSAKPRRPPALPGLALALALAAAGCSRGADERPRNLLLVTVDTLRADHLGCYGYERPTSPAIDALAAESVLFERAKATSSWTLPTLASLLTSTTPPAHGCRDNRASLPRALETMAERLSQAGLYTGAIVNHIFLDERYGLGQGFDEYDQELVKETSGASHRAITSPRVTEKAIEWLDARAQEGGARPWFLWVHYFDPHTRFNFHEGVTEAFATPGPEGPTYTAIDLYDGEIAFTDRSIGELLEALAQRGFADDTVVAFVADHGEAFGEHGSVGHRETLYKETVRVPAMLRVPGLAPRRYEPPVSTLAIAPTLLAAVGVEAPDGMRGVNLLPVLLEGVEHRQRPILAELEGRDLHLASVQHGRWKLIHDLREDDYELYDMYADPLELRDLSSERADVMKGLRWVLKDELQGAQQRRQRTGAAPKVRLREEDRRRLESLGYGGD